MKQLLLIINPTAGTKKSVKNLAEIISVFNRADFDVHVYITTSKGDAKKAVGKLGTDADLIVCCGGDGTLNETVTGIIDYKLDVPIGYIPAGSTNDFAASLNLSGDVIEAAKQIAGGRATAIDVGKFSDYWFTYVASFGAFTKTSYTTPQNIKNSLGHVAYLLEGIQELSSIRKVHVRIEIEDEVVEDDYLFGAICNSTRVGGVLTLNPEIVDMSDGKFEVLLVRAPRDLVELHECIVALKKQEYNCGMITFRSAKSIKVYTDSEMYWSLDGEKASADKEVEITNLNKRIEIVY